MVIKLVDDVKQEAARYAGMELLSSGELAGSTNGDHDTATFVTLNIPAGKFTVKDRIFFNAQLEGGATGIRIEVSGTGITAGLLASTGGMGSVGGSIEVTTINSLADISKALTTGFDIETGPAIKFQATPYETNLNNWITGAFVLRIYAEQSGAGGPNPCYGWWSIWKIPSQN